MTDPTEAKPLDLEAIKSRRRLATPEEWSSCGLDILIERGGRTVCIGHMTEYIIPREPMGQDSDINEAWENATFVGHAPQDIRDLIAALESTRAELAKVTAERDAAIELAVELKQILEQDYNTNEYMSRDDATAYVREDIATRNPAS